MVASRTQIKLPSFKRYAELDASKSAKEDRTIQFSFSSDRPVTRYSWWDDEEYDEFLSHDPDHVLIDRIKSGACPLLWNHDVWGGDQRGIILEVSFAEGRASCVAKISRSAKGEELWQDIEDGIVTSASFMYRIYEYEELETEEAEAIRDRHGLPSNKKRPMRLATSWEIFEISLVPVPADYTVGVGKSSEKERPNFATLTKNMSEKSDLDAHYKSEIEKRDARIQELESTIGQLKRDKELSDRYFKLRRQAESLMSAMKFPKYEFDAYFGEPEADISELQKSASADMELYAIQKILSVAERRTALLNTEIKTGAEPLPASSGQSLSLADENKAIALVNRNFGRIEI